MSGSSRGRRPDRAHASYPPRSHFKRTRIEGWGVMGVNKNWAIRVGVTAIALGSVGLPTAYAVQGTAPTGAVAAATVQLDVNASKGACSGALLSPRWVVTATSCFAETQDKPVVQGRPANITTATIG